jgi:hypothetical protein
MKSLICIILAAAILWATPVLADRITVVEGRIHEIEQDHLMMGSQRYTVIYPATEKGKTDAENYGFETECWVVVPTEPYRIDFITLVKVGYVDLARLTLEKGVVRKIEVLDLQQ